MTRTPSFLCNNCSAQTSLGLDECPHCGAHFDQVYCSQCHYKAAESEFVDGCPRCGYMGSAANAANKAQKQKKKRGKSGSKIREFFLSGWDPSIQVLIFAVGTAFVLLFIVALLWFYDKLQ